MTISASNFFSSSAAPSASVEAAFFTALKTGNDTFKKTSAGRFEALDAILLRHLAATPTRLGELLDIGISSGITTLELDAALTGAGRSMRITGTDLSLDAFIVPLMRGCRALVDVHGHPLQYEVFNRTVRPWRRRLDYFNGMLIFRSLLNMILRPRARAALQAGRILKRVELISWRLKKRRDIIIAEDDVTIANPAFTGRFDVIRAANILNRDYFDPVTLQRALANVARYLAGPGALLLIARTHADGVHDGTLFEVAHDGVRLNVVDRFGKGSEVEALILSAVTAAANR